MNFDAIQQAPAAIQWHALAAIVAFALGLVQLLARKGTRGHRALGWVWAALMALVALSSFFIHTICNLGAFSPIHALSLFTLLALPVALQHARAHRARAHGRTMQAMFVGALVIAGAFTLAPGRLMHDLVFGTQRAHSACRSDAGAP